MKIAIVIPAHNEAMTIGNCLTSIKIAIEQLPATITADVLVVLDSCTDDTLKVVQDTSADMNVDYLCCVYQCVGQVRDLGIRQAISQGATWIANTDADSIVAPNWLLEQIAHIADKPTDMICGVVSVDSWDHLTAQTRKDYIAHYQDTMEHRHIHGANLSFRSDAYLSVDGFAPLPCHEDVSLVKKFEAQNYNIIWSNRVRVITSSRLQARAAEGFAAFLTNLENNNLK